MAQRITTPLFWLGRIETKDPAKLQLLRKAAETGLAASMPDVAKAAAELDHDFPPATHKITDEPGGFFKLEPISTPTPDREAEALAAAIEHEVDWLRGATGDVGRAKLETLSMMTAGPAMSPITVSARIFQWRGPTAAFRSRRESPDYSATKGGNGKCRAVIGRTRYRKGTRASLRPWQHHGP